LLPIQVGHPTLTNHQQNSCLWLEGWRAGGLEGWRAGGLEGWRAGGLEGWRGREFLVLKLFVGYSWHSSGSGIFSGGKVLSSWYNYDPTKFNISKILIASVPSKQSNNNKNNSLPANVAVFTSEMFSSDSSSSDSSSSDSSSNSPYSNNTIWSSHVSELARGFRIGLLTDEAEFKVVAVNTSNGRKGTTVTTIFNY
jgi:hypothetical protein